MAWRIVRCTSERYRAPRVSSTVVRVATLAAHNDCDSSKARLVTLLPRAFCGGGVPRPAADRRERRLKTGPAGTTLCVCRKRVEVELLTEAFEPRGGG